MKSTLVAAMLLGSGFLACGASPAGTTSKNLDHTKATRYLRDIRGDAAQIQSTAAHLDELAASSNATWIDYDREWNLIKPSVEDMQMQLERLQAMQSSLSPAERTEVDQTKPLVGEIQSKTHQFLTLLDTPGVPTNNPEFKTYASSLKNEAWKLEKLVPVS